MIKIASLLFLTLTVIEIDAQDLEPAEDNSDHRIYLSVMGGGFHASKKSAVYF